MIEVGGEGLVRVQGPPRVLEGQVGDIEPIIYMLPGLGRLYYVNPHYVYYFSGDCQLGRLDTVRLDGVPYSLRGLRGRPSGPYGGSHATERS